jgi:hypothetical protein
MNGQNVQGQVGGQNVQGQVAQNENPLLKFMTLLENEPNLSKQWMCKVCGLRFRGSCQRAYHHLLGDSQSTVQVAFSSLCQNGKNTTFKKSLKFVPIQEKTLCNKKIILTIFFD